MKFRSPWPTFTFRSTVWSYWFIIPNNDICTSIYIQDMRQKYWTMKYRSRWPTFFMLSIVVTQRTNIPIITVILEIVFKILGKIAGAWKYYHHDLDLITLNIDAINMSDAYPSLRSCLYKQTATYYFIEALIHEIGFKIYVKIIEAWK